MAAFYKLLLCLQTPNLYNYRAKSAVVSGGYLKYSHFYTETKTRSLMSFPGGPKGIFLTGFPKLTFAQYPSGGVGMSCLTQIFSSRRPDNPNSLASFTIGVA